MGRYLRRVSIITIFIALFIYPSLIFAGQKVYFYHTDAAGTPVAMTDASGNVVWQADYKPFGEEQSVAGSIENNERFTGKEKDEETGFYYFGARYLDAGIGRFVSVDPAGIAEKDLLNPQRLNRYNYSLNNPYRYIDPDGRSPLALILLPILYNLLFPSTANAPEDITTPTVSSQSALEFAGGVAAMETGGYVVGRIMKGVVGSNIANILKPGGKLIGEAGSSSRIRIIQGGQQAAEKLFNKLSEGGTIIKDPRYPGTIVELKNGGRIGYRPVSSSGPPTIDVHNVPDLPKKLEIKFTE